MTRKEYREEAIQAYLSFREMEREATKSSSISSYPDERTWDGRQFYIGRAVSRAISKFWQNEGRRRYLPTSIDVDGYERISVRSLWRDPDTYFQETPSETQSRLNAAMRHAARANRFGRDASISKKRWLYRERKEPFVILPPRPLPCSVAPDFDAYGRAVSEPTLEVRP